MKVLILFSDNEQRYLDSILSVFAELEINTECFLISSLWKGDDDGLWIKLSESSHLLIIVSNENIKSDWFFYTVGYEYGTGIPLFFLKSSKEQVLPSYLSTYPFSDSLDVLKEYYKENMLIWNRQFKIDKAKEELSALNIFLSKDEFAGIVINGDEKAVELFLSAEFSVDTKNRNGVTLLSLAVRNGHRRIIPILLKSGADVNLISDDRGNTPLMDAAASGEDEILIDLIRAGAKLNICSKLGQTALMLAINNGKTNISDFLLRSGADVAIKDNMGMDARDYARIFKRKEIIRLIDHALNK